MEIYSTSEFRSGLKVIIDKSPFEIVENVFIKPGKGQAFNRLKLRNIKNGRILERTMKSGETLQGADVKEIEVQYLYSDGYLWYFMDMKTFDQLHVDKNIMGSSVKWLKEQDVCTLTLYNDSPIAVLLPNFVELLVKSSDPSVKGDTVQYATKLAVVETETEIQVPTFIKEGNLIKIDTRTGKYISRVKN